MIKYFKYYHINKNYHIYQYNQYNQSINWGWTVIKRRQDV